MNSVKWRVAKTYSDILYHKADGIAKVTINRPAKRNAFRPETVAQMYDAFADAREDQSIGVVLLTGAGPHTDGKYAGYGTEAGRPPCHRVTLTDGITRDAASAIEPVLRHYAATGTWTRPLSAR